MVKKNGSMKLIISIMVMTLCSTRIAADGFIPESFSPPTLISADEFVLEPLGPRLVEIDYIAYMSSIEHLQRTFSRGGSWPNDSITREDAMIDMQTEQARFEARESFAYAVLDLDREVELGCVYVYPSKNGVLMPWFAYGSPQRSMKTDLMKSCTNGAKIGWRTTGLLRRRGWLFLVGILVGKNGIRCPKNPIS